MFTDYFINVSWQLLALAFAGAALTIAMVGSLLTRRADQLAAVTGYGEAIFGAVMLGAITSLPGIITTMAAGWQGYPELAVSNAVGGIAAQTVFLAFADLAYRHANLEYAAASVENLLQGALLVTLLALPILAAAGPAFTLGPLHPVSLLLLFGYLFGLRLTNHARQKPRWQPLSYRLRTKEEQLGDKRPNMPRLWGEFLAAAAVVAVAGFLVAQMGIALSEKSGLSQGVVGMLFTAVATSLPEAVTSIAAVRQGALNLAVGGIIGGNCFDVLFLTFGDLAYLDGSIYHAISPGQLYTIALAQLLTGILLLGLLRRERSGFANIGFESSLIILFYISGTAILSSFL